MTINFEYETEIKLNLDYETIINQVVEMASDYEECPYEIEVSVVLTDNESIRQINAENRQIDQPTDVLSFPMIDYEEPANFTWIEEEEPDYYFNPDSGELVLGDIVISVEKVMEQAEKYGHSQKRELAFLTAHSMLHLFGYDHMVDEERVVMEEKQNEILNKLGIVRE
ncbi:rRNA maturation RNase YbeY [Anaerosporobacter faecicola]|uniref:rRNA maturation RNase YbeY n=1 Tax=Anaerosporobacter faecicola TaxID=2718714 RepID=UPI00143A2B3A|nr:rRNA maturation RNase YbeY [Anaerosporobacter faecicola]